MKRIFIFMILIFFLFACAKKNIIKDKVITKPEKETKVLISKPEKKETQKTNRKPIGFFNRQKAEKPKINTPLKITRNKKYPLGNKKEKVDLVFDNMDVYEVVNTVIGDILGKDFVIDPSIRNKISMKLSGNYTHEELFEIMAKALDISGLAIIKDKNIFKIIKKNNMAKDINIFDNSNLYLVDIVQLKHLASYQVVNYIRPFLSSSAVAISVNSSNSVIIADRKDNIRNIKKIMELLDSAIFQGIKFKILKLKFLTSKEGVKLANEILRSRALFSKNGILKNVFVSPLKSNNALLFIARDEQLMEFLIKLIKEADIPDDVAMSKVYVVPVANVKAEDLANILKQLYGGKASKTKKGKVIVRGSSFNSGTLKGEVVFIPDKINNLLVIKASPDDYKIIFNVLKKLDVVPRQVLIDVLIAEISYNDSLTYGIQWYLKNHGVKINGRSYNGAVNYNANLATPSEGSIIGSESLIGFSYALYDKAGGIRGILNALEEHSKVKILASPSILAVDNKEARIEIGQEVPIIKQTVTNTNSDSNNITNSVEYRKTGVILEVKPQINPTGLVRLDVTEEVSEAQKNKTSGIDSPIFLNRSAKTSLVAHNNETIIIGGLIKEKKDTTTSGVPVLRSIPVLGYFFGGESHSKERTELVIAITPHIINTNDLTTYYSEEFLNRLREIKNKLRQRRENTFYEMQVK